MIITATVVAATVLAIGVGFAVARPATRQPTATRTSSAAKVGTASSATTPPDVPATPGIPAQPGPAGEPGPAGAPGPPAQQGVPLPANPGPQGPSAGSPVGPPSVRQLDISNNYAWARGSVSWTGTSATTSGKIHDTPQLDSRSWLRIAYKTNVDGSWKQAYVQPDPFVKAANGEERSFQYSFPGPVKDVWWDLCSDRNGKTYCTGWK
jgi:hypothetical protein